MCSRPGRGTIGSQREMRPLRLLRSPAAEFYKRSTDLCNQIFIAKAIAKGHIGSIIGEPLVIAKIIPRLWPRYREGEEIETYVNSDVADVGYHATPLYS